MKINLNADLGESFGAWTMGDDEALLQVVEHRVTHADRPQARKVRPT